MSFLFGRIWHGKSQTHPSGVITSVRRRSNMATAGKPLPQAPLPIRDVETGEHDDGLLAFAPVRPRLFGIAYRMLGSAGKPKMSCKTYGCGGSPQIGTWSRTRPHT